MDELQKHNTEWKKSHMKFGSIYTCLQQEKSTHNDRKQVSGAWGSGFRALSIMGHEKWGGAKREINLSNLIEIDLLQVDAF